MVDPIIAPSNVAYIINLNKPISNYIKLKQFKFSQINLNKIKKNLFKLSGIQIYFVYFLVHLFRLIVIYFDLNYFSRFFV